LPPRPDGDPIAHLRAYWAQRAADLSPLREQRMRRDPFAFFRGSALLMADDLASAPATPLEVTLCGDAHAANFGVFASPEGHLVFDVDDFDEVATGPFEWDLKRLATSLALVARRNGLDARDSRRVVLDTATAYQSSMDRFARLSRLDVWYAQLDVAGVLDDLQGFFDTSTAREVHDVVESASGPSERALRQRVVRDGDTPQFRFAPPLLSPLSDVAGGATITRADVEAVLRGYGSSLTGDRATLLSQFTFLDAARLVRGVGSVGTACFVALLCGRDADDVFLLQVKEALPSVLDVARGRVETTSAGERIVAGQRMMQATPDELLGWGSLDVGGRERSFYVRQLFEAKATVDLDGLGAAGLTAYGRACAWTLARAHARSGRASEIVGYVGAGSRFATVIADFARAYANRVREDYAQFCAGPDGSAGHAGD
jgi:uncharacterized protein (DUF2252 family)